MNRMETKVPGFVIRQAAPEDTPLILSLIRGLAEYEQMPNDVTADVDTLRRNIFDRRGAEVLIGEAGGKPVCFALYFHNFSTFTGKPGLYLEDLFVMPEHRGKGYGGAMLAYLAHIAKERDCGRFEWVCLDWNEPALKVYRAIGAQPQKQWVIQRLDGDALTALAEKF